MGSGEFLNNSLHRDYHDDSSEPTTICLTYLGNAKNSFPLCGYSIFYIKGPSYHLSPSPTNITKNNTHSPHLSEYSHYVYFILCAPASYPGPLCLLPIEAFDQSQLQGGRCRVPRLDQQLQRLRRQETRRLHPRPK